MTGTATSTYVLAQVEACGVGEHDVHQTTWGDSSMLPSLRPRSREVTV